MDTRISTPHDATCTANAESATVITPKLHGEIVDRRRNAFQRLERPEG